MTLLFLKGRSSRGVKKAMCFVSKAQLSKQKLSSVNMTRTQGRKYAKRTRVASWPIDHFHILLEIKLTFSYPRGGYKGTVDEAVGVSSLPQKSVTSPFSDFHS